jgi:hypothetical protein
MASSPDSLPRTSFRSSSVGAQYVLHVASPVPVTDPKNDDELVRPARDGTLRILKAARGCGKAGRHDVVDLGYHLRPGSSRAALHRGGLDRGDEPRRHVSL